MTVLWNSVGVILIDFMSKKATINSVVYIYTLKKLKARIQRVRPVLEMSKVLLQHDNAMPHTSLKTHKVITSPHICYTWHRLTSICLGPSKKSLRGQHFFSDEEGQNCC